MIVNCQCTLQATEFSAEQKAEVLKIHKECRAVSGMTETDEDNIIQHHYDNLDKDKMKKHFVCVAKKVHYMHEDGTLDIEEIKKRSAEQKSTPAEIQRIVDECAIQKDSPGRTAIHFFKCKHDVIGEINLKA